MFSNFSFKSSFEYCFSDRILVNLCLLNFSFAIFRVQKIAWWSDQDISRIPNFFKKNCENVRFLCYLVEESINCFSL